MYINFSSAVCVFPARLLVWAFLQVDAGSKTQPFQYYSILEISCISACTVYKVLILDKGCLCLQYFSEWRYMSVFVLNSMLEYW
jgi:hypothetical protein